MDYKQTLNLPKTDFPMKADLPMREPVQVTQWQREKTYEQMIAARHGRPSFILHDGPPYANGNIHFGHILNKVLKDIVVKAKAMAGFYTPFIPGWDCHGLPIELEAEKELGGRSAERSVVALRKACRAYAERYVAIQREEFQRLGCFGAWESPYRTMDFAYQAGIVREFATCVGKGYVSTGLKPIHWCASCRTALAEAEVEYEMHTSPSIYVKFVLDAADDLRQRAGVQNLPVSLVIWTTTPWTIPANLGLALHPEYPYVLVEVSTLPLSLSHQGRGDKELWIVAEDLCDTMMVAIGITDYTIKARLTAQELERRTCRHPLIDRPSLIVLGDHVTLEAGTGVVHTAPGHGQEDHAVGQTYGLQVFAPVDDRGCFTAEAQLPWLTGIFVEKANPLIIDKLREVGALVHDTHMEHQYPHCWRCKKPVIFRATEQWFIGMEPNRLRERALAAIDAVQWIPPWGRNRIHGMIAHRPDWCISRQRAWGVPIVAVHCAACGRRSTTEALVRHVAERFVTEGADAWFTHPIETLIPAGYVCLHCGRPGPFRKENDILDVWFDAGASFAAALESQAGIPPPADLYLEGSDQHRGWFHSALLIGIGTRDAPPYRAVLTHGFVVDHEGRKYSKSAKNYVPPEQTLNRYGAELLRLWVAAEDYRNDIHVSEEILTRLADSYRKIRNTWRFLLGNLSDFDPTRDGVPEVQLTDLDRWALERTRQLVTRCRQAYDAYEFHVVYHAVNAYCTTDLSAFYLDICKDRLYCEATQGKLRRSAQTVLWQIAETLTRLVAPILSFTAEEVWRYVPKAADAPASVFLADLPPAEGAIDSDRMARWERFRVIRGEAAKVLEAARKEKVIGSSLEARLVIQADTATQAFLQSFGNGLADLLIVSDVTFGAPTGTHVLASKEVVGLTIGVERMTAPKCARCWKLSKAVGRDTKHPAICARCVGVVG